jgi:hypothetical protein
MRAKQGKLFYSHQVKWVEDCVHLVYRSDFLKELWHLAPLINFLIFPCNLTQVWLQFSFVIGILARADNQRRSTKANYQIFEKELNF